MRNGLCGKAKEMRNAFFDGRVMNPHGKPDAGKPPVRFDEGGGIGNNPPLLYADDNNMY